MPRLTLRSFTLATVLSAIALGVGACSRIDYDTTKARDWVEVYTIDGAQFPTYIDRSSIKSSEEGVQFDQMGKSRESDGIHSSIATFTVNCANGTRTELVRTNLNGKGKPIQQERKLWQISDHPEVVAANLRGLCREVGAEPKF